MKKGMIIETKTNTKTKKTVLQKSIPYEINERYDFFRIRREKES